MTDQWQWDETLYRGSAAYYAQGRLPYAPSLADQIAEELGLDGSGRLLDVGCGPGILTLTLAPHFAEVIGVDPDPGMLEEGARRAEAAGITNITWLQARAEELTPSLGTFRAVAFAQSFHWVDQRRVARIVADLLEPDGAFIHVCDLKHPLPPPPSSAPPPPYEEIGQLVKRYLGPTRRAGQSPVPYVPVSTEAAMLAEAGYRGPIRLLVPAGQEVTRTPDDLVAWTYSLSSSTPYLFGERLSEFEQELRTILADASPTGKLAEVVPDTEVRIWRRPEAE